VSGPRKERTIVEKLSLSINGMSCGHCVARVTKALSGLDGVSVEHVEVGSARLSYDPSKVTTDRITRAVDDIGFEARVA
jgi:copper chaperone